MDYSTLLTNISRQVTLTDEETSLVTSLMTCKTLEAGNSCSARERYAGTSPSSSKDA